MTFSIGLRTALREVDYLTATLKRLSESGTMKHPQVRGLHVTYGHGLTPNENGARALELALKDNPDWVIFLEDDIDVLDDFIGSISRWLTDHERPKVHLYPLACQYSQCFEEGKSFWEYSTPAYYGSQGLILRAEPAKAFINFVRHEWKPPRAFDLALARWHEAYEPEATHFITPVPCFIDHLGDVSTFGYNVGRFVGFKGREYSYRAEVAVG